MKALVIARPQFPIPPEQAPMVVEGALEWYARYKDRLTEFGTFLGGGGFAVVDIDSTDELNKMIVEMPFSLFMDIRTELYMEGDSGFRQFQDAMQAMMESMAP
jgi:hypothetical protein